MEEHVLNILLECSVCLERLDETSKLLPCQHTFCKQCLIEIKRRQGVLLCPECRRPVNEMVEDLPNNILLVRLLEGTIKADFFPFFHAFGAVPGSGLSVSCWHTTVYHRSGNLKSLFKGGETRRSSSSPNDTTEST